MEATSPPARPRRGPITQLKRAGLLSAMSLATVNVWTGSPLMALWIGSRVSLAGAGAMVSFAVVGVSMGAISLALVQLLARLSAVYDRLVGRPPQTRRHVPWMRSMRGERPHERGAEYRLSALEKILVASVVLVVVAFEIWFFFYSSSPIDGRTGRYR